FEDVILQRVLSDVQAGCYVDVGASHPIVDSNTYALYEKGWRGICVEPLGYGEIWNEARIEDIFINAVLGDKPGQTTFYIYRETQQLSTTSIATVEAWRKDGKVPDESISVPVLTLNDLLDQHLGGRNIHLLSIDVEGMEKEVLSGIDLRKYRPWVMVLESTRPGTPEPCWEEWEPGILQAGYSMVYFDGLNRFYLSGEQQDLRARFALPPNVWDQFVLARELESREKCVALEASVRRLTEELDAVRSEGFPPGSSGWLRRLRSVWRSDRS
ncbi:MAG: FkbM family methyltransferase, partial [Betaproteobacteria bacterium]